MRDYLPAGKNGRPPAPLVAWEQGDSEPQGDPGNRAGARALGYHEVSELFSQADGPQLNRLGMDRLEEYRPPAAAIGRIPGAARRAPPAHAAGVFCSPLPPAPGQWLDDDLAEEMEVDDGRPDQGRVWRAVGGRQYVAALCGRADRFGHARPRRPKTARSCCACLNGQGYCKKLKYDADGVYLVSLNPAYEPIPVQENDEFRIAGVVGGGKLLCISCRCCS